MSRNTTLVPMILCKNDEYWLPYSLQSVAGRFSRYVIYDVGSNDESKSILERFVEQESKEADCYVRYLPDAVPEIQGAFRNSMIAEARCDWVLILDADEVYSKQAMDNIIAGMSGMEAAYFSSGGKKIYGVFRRREVLEDLTMAYSDLRSHHRVYHRTAIFDGTHPGEDPHYPQDEKSEHWFYDVICTHFHNTKRSRFDEDVPARIRRRTKKTYHPGTPIAYDLFEELPKLKEPIHGFKVNPYLESLQNVF